MYIQLRLSAPYSFANRLTRIPTSGGQYYWVAVLAPRSTRRYLSYLTGKCLHLLYLRSNHSYVGWLCAVAWQTAVSASGYFIGTLIQALLILNVPSYVPHNWHGSLIGLAFLIIAVTFNTVLARHLPMVEGIFVFCHIVGIVIMIPLWILSPRREGGSPLIDFGSPSAWTSNGVATMVGSTIPISTLIGFDCSVHMGMFDPFAVELLFLHIIAEETKDSSRIVPVSLLVGYATNVLLGFFVVITW
jgi:Amino acid permease